MSFRLDSFPTKGRVHQFIIQPLYVAERRVGVILLVIFLIPTLAPIATAEWDEDNWLWNIIGPERLALGDEFGCHGYEGVDINVEQWIIEACRDYLMGFTNASRWGSNPISFGLPYGTENEAVFSTLIENNFSIIGDLAELERNDLHVFSRTTTLEKNQVEMEFLTNATKDELLSIYWIAKWHDVKIREDKEAIALLVSQDVWYTTWGEWYNHKYSGENIYSYIEELTDENTTDGYSRIHIINNYSSTNGWQVPGTVFIEWNGTDPLSWLDSGNLEADDKILRNGYRYADGGAYLTLSPGQEIILEFIDPAPQLSITPQLTFNGLHHSVTIVGHHVTDLHQWSSDFYDSQLRFTWLIERPAALKMNWILPIIAVSVLIATPVIIKKLVQRDQDSQNINQS